jgi:hypothetical protein
MKTANHPSITPAPARAPKPSRQPAPPVPMVRPSGGEPPAR